MSKPIVLVTGVSGFLAGHVAKILLGSGYAVRGTARSAKAAILKSSDLGKNADLEVVEVEDIATSDLSDAFKGVASVIHTASPLAGKQSLVDALKSSKEGTLNVLRQAVKSGVTKVVLTSSWGTTLDPSLKKTYAGITFTEKDWGSVTEEEYLAGGHNPLWDYLATKIFAEKAAWQFAKENPSLDLATINSPFLFGPSAPGFPVQTNAGLGTNRWIYALIAGEKGRPMPMQFPPFFCDVRDVAQAHVNALNVPATSILEDKRFLISGGAFTWKQAVELIIQKKPELENRVPSLENVPPLPGPLSAIDVSRAKDKLKMETYIPWDKTVEDTVDYLLSIEHQWK